MEPTDSDQPRYQLRNRTTTVSTSSSQVTTMSHANLPAIDGHMAEGRSEEEATDASQTDNIAHPQCAATQPTISMPAACRRPAHNATNNNNKASFEDHKSHPFAHLTSFRRLPNSLSKTRLIRNSYFSYRC